MKTAFLAMLAVLALASWAAWRWVPPPPGQGRTVLVWATDNNPVRQTQVDLFNKLNPDLYLMVDPSGNDLSKIIVQCSAGIGPDLINCQTPADLDALVHAGIPMDITDDLRASGIDMPKLVWPIALDVCTENGRDYGFPCNVSAVAIWFNKDVFDRSGVPYPRPGWSWDDLIETSKRLTLRDSNGKPIQFGFGLEWWSMDLLSTCFGATEFSHGGTRCTLDTPESIQAYSLAQDLMYKYRCAPTPGDEATLASEGGWLTGSLTYLMSGRAAMALGARWWLNRLREQKGLRLGVVEVPTHFADQPATGGQPEVGGAGRAALVNRFTTHKEAALRFMRFLAGQPYNELINSQADGLAPVKAFCLTPRFLHDPAHPEEDYNQLWLDVQGRAKDDSFSPFLRGGDLDVITTQTDLIENGLKPAPEALRKATQDANDLIVQNAQRRTRLKELYRQVTGREP